MRALLLVLAACKSASGVVDVSASVEPVQHVFDAHAGEAHFVTLLSPT